MASKNEVLAIQDGLDACFNTFGLYIKSSECIQRLNTLNEELVKKIELRPTTEQTKAAFKKVDEKISNTNREMQTKNAVFKKVQESFEGEL